MASMDYVRYGVMGVGNVRCSWKPPLARPGFGFEGPPMPHSRARCRFGNRPGLDIPFHVLSIGVSAASDGDECLYARCSLMFHDV
jgi:hypothetical protein